MGFEPTISAGERPQAGVTDTHFGSVKLYNEVVLSDAKHVFKRYVVIDVINLLALCVWYILTPSKTQLYIILNRCLH